MNNPLKHFTKALNKATQTTINKTLKKNKLVKNFRKKRKTILIGFLLLINITLPGILITSSVYSLNNSEEIVYTRKINQISTFQTHEITFNKIAELEVQITNKKIEDKRIEEENKKIEERQNKVDRANNLFRKYGSVMTGYGEIIVRKAEECGGDFRVLIGIAGNESGLGRIPYKLYNPYGYLDGRQYAGWNESLEFLSCVISQRFLQPCNNDLYCIINKYGGPETDKDKWVQNVQFFMNQI